MKRPFLEAGKIVGTFGVRGEVKLQPWCDSAEFLLPFRRLYIGGTERKVASSRVHKGMLIVRFEGVEDVNAAMELKDRIVTFAREDAKLSPGSFFLADIIGAQVVDEARGPVGTLTEVLDLPAGRVYVVRGKEEHTIPAVPEFVLETDADAGIVRVRMIEGM